MSTKGHFVWYELMTTDTAAAAAFYGEVLGWGARDAGMEGQPYTLLSAGEAQIGGMMAMPEAYAAGGGRPGWIGYIAVPDVDAGAAQVQQAGGAVHRAAEDIPGVGRFAVVADPQGAAFVLFKGNGQMPPAPPPGTPGHAGWHELHATDWPAEFAFYAGLFGWTKGEAIDIGPMGTYQLFAIDAVPSGGMMTDPDAGQRPFWMYYFNVRDIRAAAATVTAKGGQVLHGPHEVPGGAWIVNCADPQGAMFALVAPPG